MAFRSSRALTEDRGAWKGFDDVVFLFPELVPLTVVDVVRLTAGFISSVLEREPTTIGWIRLLPLGRIVTFCLAVSLLITASLGIVLFGKTDAAALAMGAEGKRRAKGLALVRWAWMI